MIFLSLGHSNNHGNCYVSKYVKSYHLYHYWQKRWFKFNTFCPWSFSIFLCHAHWIWQILILLINQTLAGPCKEEPHIMVSRVEANLWQIKPILCFVMPWQPMYLFHASIPFVYITHLGWGAVSNSSLSITQVKIYSTSYFHFVIILLDKSPWL